MNTQDIQDLIMSYVFSLATVPLWYINAWNAATTRSAAFDEVWLRSTGWISPADVWNREYPKYRLNEDGRTGHWAITFPDEQSYIWFVLKWS